MPDPVGIVDCIHIDPATTSFEDLATVAQENFTNHTADVFVRGAATDSFGLGNSFQGQEVHKLNSRTEPNSNSDKNCNMVNTLVDA